MEILKKEKKRITGNIDLKQSFRNTAYELWQNVVYCVQMMYRYTAENLYFG
jgi:hypothetical protein